MQNGRKGRGALREIWHGEQGAPPALPPLQKPVAPAQRTWVMLGAYLLLLLGIVLILTSAIVLLLWFDALSRWHARALVGVIAIGGVIVYKATTLFDGVEQTAPLPDARVR